MMITSMLVQLQDLSDPHDLWEEVMVLAENFCRILKRNGFDLYTGVPCSILKPIINYLLDEPNVTYYTATSEGEAMGIAAGFSLSGKMPVVLMQNSGLGNAVNPLTSLHLIYNLPALLLVSWRGEPGKADEPEHRIMGPITPKLLDVMEIYNECLVESNQKLGAQIFRMKDMIAKTNRPVALVVKKGSFTEYIQKSTQKELKRPLLRRKEAIKIIVDNLTGDEAIVSTTGKISRELYYDGKEAETNFYVVGSMGCALSIGFGIAEQKPEKKVIVLDGDGAILMKMGTLTTVGHYKPPNLIHIVLDNEVYDSTGHQPTVSATVDLGRVALNSGYANSVKVYTQEGLKTSVENALKTNGPHFILVKVLKGADKDLGRPKLTCLQIKDRFMQFLKRS